MPTLGLVLRASMRPLFLLALCAALSAPAIAQSSLVLRGGLARMGYDAGRTETFDETYSGRYVARLDGPTDLLPETGDGVSVGAGWRSVGRVSVGLTYDYAWAGSDARSRFENGAGDRVETRIRDHALAADVSVGVLPRVSVGAVAAATFRRVRITSRAIHADGSESLGGEYTLNGVYDGDAVGFEGGGQVRLGLTRRLAVVGRALVPLGSPGGDLGIPLRDDALGQLSTSFPRDFDRWFVDALDDGAALTPEDFTGLRLQVTLELRPF